MSGTRSEKDSFGPIDVPADRLWGAQTERSRRFFRISSERMPLAVVHALALVKRSAARVNASLGLLDAKKSEAIARAADEVLAGRHDEEFPLVGLADRLGHAVEHERQRGARQPRLRDPRRRARPEAPAASERRRQPRPVVERRLPHRDARRGRARGAADADPGARPAERDAGRQARRLRSPSSRSAARTCRTPRRSRWGRNFPATWRSSSSRARRWRRCCRACTGWRSAAPRSAPA